MENNQSAHIGFPSPVKTYHQASYPSIEPTRSELSTKGKNVLITGGGSGIGAAITHAFAASGAARIAILGRTSSTLASTKASISASYPSTTVYTYVSDIVDDKSVSEAINHFAQEAGKIDIVISNAGYMHAPKSLLSVEPNDWWRTWEINVKGAFNLVRAVAPHLAENAIVENVSSASAQAGYIPSQNGYQGSKAGALKIFNALAIENPGVRVVSWHPGSLETQMLDLAKEAGLDVPVDEMSLPASFSVWAASPEAEFLNGKFVWAHWDVDELKAMETDIKSTSKFTMVLNGFPDIEAKI